MTLDTAKPTGRRLFSRLAEPATSLTDVLLAVVAFGCAWWIWAAYRVVDGYRVAAVAFEDHPLEIEIGIASSWLSLWTAALVMLGAAALVGAVQHGLPFVAGRGRLRAARAITVLLALCSAAIWAAVVVAVQRFGPFATILAGVGAAKLLAMLAVNAPRAEGPRFAASLADLVSSLVLVALLGLVRNPVPVIMHQSGADVGTWPAGTLWLIGGVAAALLAGAVQLLRIAPHPRFDHNALFHVLLLPALLLLAAGAIRVVSFMP